MFIFFLSLTILSALVLIAGLILWLSTSGVTTRRSGRDVGAEIMGGSAGDEEGVSVSLLDKSVFAGKGVAVERKSEMSYAEIKRLVREGNRRAALGPVMTAAGLFGFVVFGVLALWVGLDDKLVATLIAAPVLYTMARIARDFKRA